MGRTDFTGPVSGGYIVFSYDRRDRAAGAATDEVQTRFKIPVDCRVMEATISTASASGGASRPTFQITNGGTDLFSADRAAVSAGDVVITPTSTTAKLVSGQRDLDKGDVLILTGTFVASEVVTGLRVQIVCKVGKKGSSAHVVATTSRPDEFAND